jgi:hypothetical protein
MAIVGQTEIMSLTILLLRLLRLHVQLPKFEKARESNDKTLHEDILHVSVTASRPSRASVGLFIAIFLIGFTPADLDARQ